MLEFKINGSKDEYLIEFIQFINGIGSWQQPIYKDLTRKQSIELTIEILKTTRKYLEKEFPEIKNDSRFIRCFEEVYR